MRRLILLTLVVLAAAAYPVATFAGPGGGDNGTMCSLSTQLLAENEPQGSTSEAFGHTLIKVRNDLTLAWKSHIVNPAAENFVAGHIHVAPAGVNGPVVVPLFPAPGAGPSSEQQIKDEGETTVSQALAEDICQNPDAYYVNYHTSANPGGAIRGQLG
jgi:CHRD domain